MVLYLLPQDPIPESPDHGTRGSQGEHLQQKHLSFAVLAI